MLASLLCSTQEGRLGVPRVAGIDCHNISTSWGDLCPGLAQRKWSRTSSEDRTVWKHWKRPSGEKPASLPMLLGHVSIYSQGWRRPYTLSSSTPPQKLQLPWGHISAAVLWKVLVTRSCKLDVCESLIPPGTHRKRGSPFHMSTLVPSTTAFYPQYASSQGLAWLTTTNPTV